MLTFLRARIEAQGNWIEVADLVRKTLDHGNGAKRQLWAFAQAGQFKASSTWSSGKPCWDSDPTGRPYTLSRGSTGVWSSVLIVERAAAQRHVGKGLILSLV